MGEEAKKEVRGASWTRPVAPSQLGDRGSPLPRGRVVVQSPRHTKKAALYRTSQLARKRKRRGCTGRRFESSHLEATCGAAWGGSTTGWRRRLAATEKYDDLPHPRQLLLRVFLLRANCGQYGYGSRGKRASFVNDLSFPIRLERGFCWTPGLLEPKHHLSSIYPHSQGTGESRICGSGALYRCKTDVVAETVPPSRSPRVPSTPC